MCKIATCSCGTTFYNSMGGWRRMLDHCDVILTNPVHQWVEVTDLTLIRTSAEVREDYVE